MTHGRKTLICLLSGLSACSLTTSALGNTADNPYKAIVDRNVFGLKPPPPPPDPNAEVAKTPPPKITLTGITTILGNKRALMKTPPGPPKPGEQPREQSYILAEGQREGDMEVVQIDENSGTVKVMFSGTPVTLTFEKDGAKPGTGGAPGLPSPTGIASPAGMKASFPGTDGSIRALPTRTMRMPTPTGGAPTGASMQPGAANFQPATAGSYQAASYQPSSGMGIAAQGQYNNAYSAAPGGVAMNTAAGGMSLTGPPATAAKLQPNWPPEMDLSPDEQSAMMHLQQEANKNNPNFPGFPGISNPSQSAQQQPSQQEQQSAGNQFPPTIPGFPLR